MTDVVVSLPRFAEPAEKIARHLGADLCLYGEKEFEQLFREYDRIVALMSVGIVVRKIAPLLSDKWSDPAVVVVSPDCRYAIPLVGGHHGANELARSISGLGIEPVVSTATETAGKISVEGVARDTGYTVLNRDSTRLVNAAALDDRLSVYSVDSPAIVLAGPGVSVLVRDGTYSVGIGCRRGIRKDEVAAAVTACLTELSIDKDDVMIYSTTDKKAGEAGLIAGIQMLRGVLLFLDDETVAAFPAPSTSGASRIGLHGVAEPCALASSKKKELVMHKHVYGRVTIAVAR
jgi:Cobalamin biosynthesis protein CbiG